MTFDSFSMLPYLYLSSYRRGYLERIDDYLAIFFLSWITLSPLVTFQSLLVARDDNQIAHKESFPSATEVATPLLIMQGWMTLVVTYACLTYKTGFEVQLDLFILPILLF